MQKKTLTDFKDPGPLPGYSKESWQAPEIGESALWRSTGVIQITI
jgi:hypothetical protein